MPPATLEQIRIDEATWAAGSPERQHEWRLAISEVLEEGRFDGELPSPARALITISPGVLRVDLTCGGAPLDSHSIPLSQLLPLVDEYINTCVEMTKIGVGSNSPRLEALDIAKRLTHDEGGELCAGVISSLRPDHATGRRLFTLLLTLLHDTTQLAAPPHRVHPGL